MNRSRCTVTLLFLFTVLFCRELPPAFAQQSLPATGLNISHYQATLELDFNNRTIAGEVRIDLDSVQRGNAPLRLNAVGLVIDSAAVDGIPAAFKQSNGFLDIELDEIFRSDDQRQIYLQYHGTPTTGLKFDGNQAFTAFHTEGWLPCNADPSDRATLSLLLSLPDTLVVVGSGHPTFETPTVWGKQRISFHLNIPTPAYLFGFAAGDFNGAEAQSDGRLYYYVGNGRSPDELTEIFHITPDVFRFFENLTGTAPPDTFYTQALLQADVEQEAAGLALLRASYADAILSDSLEDWLLVHEIAHQWWGYAVTCRSWSEIWLNEGFATFMTALFKEERSGREEYDREMVMARLRYKRMRDAGEDRPLHFTDWKTPQQANSSIAYDKGALFLHYLRYVLGDASFRKGIARYTSENAGGAVTSEDLRRAMEKSSGMELTAIFEPWINRAQAPGLTATHRTTGNGVEIEIRQSGPEPATFPLQIAVETDRGRQTRRVEISGERTVVEFKSQGALRSVRIDDGGHFPAVIEHERSAEMLMHQALHEPDAMGRVDALLAAREGIKTRGISAADVREAATRLAANDASRLVRQVAADVLVNLP